MTTTTRLTHEDGIAKAQAWCDETGVPWHELRWIAAADLSREMAEWLGPDHGHGIGSSDVSIHLAEMANHNPDALFGAASPLVTIAKTAKATGKTFEETKDGFRRLFAPAEET